MEVAVLLLLLISVAREVSSKSECMQIVGTLVCPGRPVLAGNVQIDLKDDDRKLLLLPNFVRFPINALYSFE
ncbi:unnamed protein product [Gongylonema pulchrum]|uniref:Transthyretin-like family protein n=1 Tax=Gongylonema pulchrum TaxID=637853 RepID=A0A183EFJ8_9BILA|nr:unnamed protein product [Gongylonema pulchrum]